MNGYNNNGESDEEEMLGLLSNTDHNSTVPKRKKSKRKKKKEAMKPLEVMHSSTARRLSDEKPSKFACQMGVAMTFLSVLIGVWIWSGQQVDENTSIQRWNGLKLRDIKDWCLDVSIAVQKISDYIYLSNSHSRNHANPSAFPSLVSLVEIARLRLRQPNRSTA